MEPTDIGDLTVEPTADGLRLRLTIAEQQSTTTLSKEGATALWAVLYDWLWSTEDVDAIVAKVREELTP
jgi:hypothetical protein